MQWRTHILSGLNSLWLLELLPGAIPRGQLPLLLGIAAFASLLPDLDAAQSKVKHLSLWGIKPFLLPSLVLNRALGHRGLLHSAAALYLVALAAIPLAAWQGWESGAALFLGYTSHLIADACTCSGVPLLYLPPFHRDRKRYHLLPKPLRFVTGSGAELALVPLLCLLLLFLLLRQLGADATLATGAFSTGFGGGLSP